MLLLIGVDSSRNTEVSPYSSMQMYTVLFITTLEGIATVAEAVSSVVHSGVVAISVASKCMHTDVVGSS